MSLSTTMTALSALFATLALLPFKTALALDLEDVCTGDVSDISCAAKMLVCAIAANADDDSDKCGDKDFWESCGKIAYQFDEAAGFVEDCEHAAELI